jgi:hypothetical protein
MPQWLALTWTFDADGCTQARQSTMPSLRECTETKPTPAGKRSLTSSRAPAQHSPSIHARVNKPGTRSDPSAATART